MCGIIAGVSSETNITPILINGLKKLEYRGYDSSGISLISNFEFNMIKEVGKVNELVKSIKKNNFFEGKIGVAHTRWSTHGKVKKENAHPHNSENFSLVHNGIIENYKDLKKDLINKGYIFKSDTDSEIILNLLEDNYKKENSVFLSIQRTLSVLVGSYALAIILKKDEKTLWAAKNMSPLIVGTDFNSSFVASDKQALSNIVSDIYYLEDCEIAKIKNNSVNFFDIQGNEKYKKSIKLNLNEKSTTKEGYNFFMEKEFYEQSTVIKNTLKDRIHNNNIKLNEISHLNDKIKNIENIEIISCGTSNHAALISKYWFENYLNIPCEVSIASEYRYSKFLTRKNTLFLTISQSGETADTLSALKLIKEKNKHLLSLSICNVEDSSISRESNATILTKAGVEIGVASTKAFITQLASLLMLVTYIGVEKKVLNPEFRKKLIYSLNSLPEKLNEFILCSKKLNNIVKLISKFDNAIYIGRSQYGSLAMEGALKLKEISYMHAESFYSGELKHGSLALINENMPVIALAPSDHLFHKTYSNIEEISSRGGKSIILTDKRIIDKNVIIFKLPECCDIIKPICFAIPLQYIAMEVAKLKGNDIDKPRNLAKSVTVE